MSYNITDNLFYTTPIIIAFITSFCLLAYLLYLRFARKRKTLLIDTMSIVLFLCTIWTLGYFFEFISSNLEILKFWIYIEYVPICFIGVVWLSLSLVYVKKSNLLRKYIAILVIPPLISYILVLTNDYHNYFFADITADGTIWGALWWFNVFFSYVYIIASVVLYVRYAFKTNNKIEKKRTFILIIGAIIPLLGNVVYIFLIRPGIIYFPLDVTPILFSVSNLFFTYGLFRYGLFDITSFVTGELMRNITSGIALLDLNNNIVEINPELLKMVNKKSSDMVGKNITEVDSIIYRQNKDVINSLLKKTRLDPNKIFKRRIEIKKPSKRYLLIVCSSIKDRRNNVLGTLLIIEDITESYRYQKEIEGYNNLLAGERGKLLELTESLEISRKSLLNITEDFREARNEVEAANKKLKKVDETRKEFVSHTAHELRTPLGVFRWSLEMLKNEDVGKINRDQRELLENIFQANKRLIDLVNNLLEISRMDQGRFKIKMSKCDLPELIDRALGELAMKIRWKQIYVHWNNPNGKLPKVKGDCERIMQVLINIINNSVKYTLDRGIITVKVKETDIIAPKEIMEKYNYIQRSKKYLLCSVADTGVGIPKKEQKKMFSRFFRASNVVKIKAEGTGLGMSITKNIIDLHSGAIWFESEEDKGTTFYFTIPITENKK